LVADAQFGDEQALVESQRGLVVGGLPRTEINFVGKRISPLTNRFVLALKPNRVHVRRTHADTLKGSIDPTRISMAKRV
jgi:hypothetical protein